VRCWYNFEDNYISVDQKKKFQSEGI